jgi:hypothetical protein
VITFEPNLTQIIELPVLGNVPRRQMTVIIEDRVILGKLMIQPAGSFGLKKEVGMNEFLHRCSDLLPSHEPSRKPAGMARFGTIATGYN